MLISRSSMLLKCLTVLFILFLSWSSPLTAQSAKGLNVRAEVKRAQNAFDQGKLATANRILSRVLKRYPDNKAAQYLMGRIYYRGGKITAAARHFKKSDLSFVDGTTAFEYGATMFAVGDCSRAGKAFRKVTVSEQKDLASFYLGVCHYQSREDSAAELALRRARKIPANFQQVKRRLLLDIQRRSREQYYSQSQPRMQYYVPVMPQAQQPVSGNLNEYGLPSGPGAPDLSDETSSQEPQKPVIIAPAKPKAGLTFSATPKVEYSMTTELSDRHGHGETTIMTQGPQGSAELRAVYRFDPDRNDRQIAISVPLTVSVKSLSGDEKVVSYESGENDGEVLANRTSNDASSRNASYTLRPGISIPLLDNIEIEGNGFFEEFLPNYKTEKKETIMGGDGALSVGFGSDINVRVYGSLRDRSRPGSEEGEIDAAQDVKFGGALDVTLPKEFNLNIDGFMTTTSNSEYGSIDGFAAVMSATAKLKKTWDSFSLALSVNQTTNTQPKEDPVSGTVDQTKGGIEGVKNFDIGLSFKLFADYTMIGLYNRTGLCRADSTGAILSCGDDTKTMANASGSRIGYGITVKATPLSWAYASATYKIQNSQYVVKEAELRPHFEDKVTNYYTFLDILVGLSYSF